MRKFTNSITACAFLAVCLLFTSCKDDSFLNVPPPVPDQSFVEEFDNYNTAIANGWKPINKSVPVGYTNWKLGSPSFSCYSSNINNQGCFYSDFNTSGLAATGAAPAVINNWLISKPLIIKNGDKIIFYTRTSTQTAPNEFPDALEVRLNTYNDRFDVGAGTGYEVGSFSNIILNINGSLLLNGPFSFPRNWTKFTATVSGVQQPSTGRFAFRHFVPDGGPDNPNGTDVAIDSVAYISAK